MKLSNTSAYTAQETNAPAGLAPPWGAVFALTVGVGTLIASEFMSVSLLTPIATDLEITEGQAGRAIAISGLFAVQRDARNHARGSPRQTFR